MNKKYCVEKVNEEKLHAVHSSYHTLSYPSKSKSFPHSLRSSSSSPSPSSSNLFSLYFLSPPVAMEDLWKRAKTFAEEAAKKSQSLTPSSSRIADLVSETAKKSKELAAEASKKADILKSAALRQADQIKSFSDTIAIPPQFAAIASAATTAATAATATAPPSATPQELEKFGVTDDLRSFVKGLTSTTFQNFPLSSGNF